MIDPLHAADLIADALRGNSAPAALLAGGLTALDAPGGGEVQLASTVRALVQAGVAARLWRPWEDDLGRANIVHLFGSLPEHLPLAAAAKRRRAAVAISTIAWFDARAVWREPRPLARRAAACAALRLRRAFPRWPSWRRRLYDAADLLLPNSQAEAEQLMQLFGVPAQRIHVVPNGADPRFADADPDQFRSRFGLRDFILYCGRIEPRKNQLQFLRALRESGLPIVVLGDPVPGQQAYYDACRREAGLHAYFLGRLEHNDPLLASAYAACRCLALVSWYETPGLAPLEAAMTGAPLVITDRGAAREYFGNLADYAPPDNLRAIRTATLAAWDRGRSRELAQHVRENFSWRTAALATEAAYHRLLDRDTQTT